MPVSRRAPRRKKKQTYTTLGANRGQRKLSRKELERKMIAFNEKRAEYEKMDLEALILMRDSGAVRGTYKDALLQVIFLKENPELNPENQKDEDTTRNSDKSQDGAESDSSTTDIGESETTS